MYDGVKYDFVVINFKYKTFVFEVSSTIDTTITTTTRLVTITTTAPKSGNYVFIFCEDLSNDIVA